MNIKINDVVKFGRPNGKTRVGTVTKINASTYGVVDGLGGKWRVSKSLVSLAEGQKVPPPVTKREVSRSFPSAVHDFAVGERIRFGRPNGRKRIGTVVGRGSKRLVVNVDGSKWYVPPVLAEAAS